MMEILNILNDAILAVADPLFGWLLHFPRDIALIVIALGTSFILTIVRKWSTDQDLLKRCDADAKRLGRLIREAKTRKDKEAIKRYRMTNGMIAMKKFKSEGKPLLWAIIPIAILGTWAFNRLDRFPPQEDRAVKVVFYFPISAVGDFAHMLPVDGVHVEGSWIKQVKAQTLTPDQAEMGLAPDGEVSWTLSAKASKEPYMLTVRHGADTYTKELLVGQTTYSAVQEMYGPNLVPCCMVELEQYKPLGMEKLAGLIPPKAMTFLQGMSVWFPPWLAAYLVLACGFVFVFKPMLHIL